MRHLGIDFGEKRIGLAYSDAREVSVATLPYITRENDEQAIKEILEICEERGIEEMVIGIPYGEDLRQTKQTERVQKFSKKLAGSTKIPVTTWNETGSTEEVIHKGGDTGNIDSESAKIILLDYLNRAQQ